MFSTEEVTFAAMRRGRDGSLKFPHLFPTSSLIFFFFARCNDVSECRCCYHLFRLLLGFVYGCIQGLVEVTYCRHECLS